MPEKSVSCGTVSTVLWTLHFIIRHMILVIPINMSGEAQFPSTWHVEWGERNKKERKKEHKHKKTIRKIEETQEEWANESTNTMTRSFSSMETLPKYVEILSWNLCFENKQRGGTGGLRLPLFHCGIIMMIKSQLQSYSKQWYAHSWGDSLSTGFPGSFFTLSHSKRQGCTGSLCQPMEMDNIAFSGERERKLDKFNVDIIAGNKT